MTIKLTQIIIILNASILCNIFPKKIRCMKSVVSSRDDVIRLLYWNFCLIFLFYYQIVIGFDCLWLSFVIKNQNHHRLCLWLSATRLRKQGHTARIRQTNAAHAFGFSSAERRQPATTAAKRQRTTTTPPCLLCFQVSTTPPLMPAISLLQFLSSPILSPAAI